MKKKLANKKNRAGNNIRREYEFTEGVRGKYYSAMQAGYTVTIHKADGTTVVKKIHPEKGTVILEQTCKDISRIRNRSTRHCAI